MNWITRTILNMLLGLCALCANAGDGLDMRMFVVDTNTPFYPGVYDCLFTVYGGELADVHICVIDGCGVVMYDSAVKAGYQDSGGNASVLVIARGSVRLSYEEQLQALDSAMDVIKAQCVRTIKFTRLSAMGQICAEISALCNIGHGAVPTDACIKSAIDGSRLRGDIDAVLRCHGLRTGNISIGTDIAVTDRQDFYYRNVTDSPLNGLPEYFIDATIEIELSEL